MTEYKKLSKQPLVFVLAEFCFSPVLNIGEYISGFQDELREQFPMFRMTESQEVSIEPNGINISKQPNWEFISKDKKQAVSINQNKVVYMTSHYDRFDGFQNTCKFIVDTVIDKVKPSLLLKLGLRYSDCIVDIENQGSSKDFIKTNFYEHSDDFQVGNPLRQINENILSTTEGMMIIRSIYEKNELNVFPDVQNLPIVLPEISNHDNKKILLDFDHIWDVKTDSEVSDFSSKLIFDKLTNMHELSRQAFWEATTEKGREAWT